MFLLVAHMHVNIYIYQSKNASIVYKIMEFMVLFVFVVYFLPYTYILCRTMNKNSLGFYTICLFCDAL